jgi:transcriptional regulator with XRE-family HTH domain
MRDFLAALTTELRRARLAKEWTQEELADRLSVSVETISNFERGATIPSLRTLFELAEVLDIDLGEVFSSPGKVQPKVSPERARREAKLQRLLAALDGQQLQLVIELARAVTRAGKKSQ